MIPPGAEPGALGGGSSGRTNELQAADAAIKDAALRRDRLSLLAVAIAYPAWVVYGSLFPLTGWRDLGVPPLAFIFAGWPHYWTAFDFVANVLLYAPLGYLWYAGLSRRFGARSAGAAVIMAAAALSFAIEVLQAWLPNRVPSNLDLLGNILGAGAGVLLAARYGHGWARRIGESRRGGVSPAAARTGAALVLAWVLIQLTPEGVLFAPGPGGFAAMEAFEPAMRMQVEASVVALHAVAVALVVAHLLPGSRAEVGGRILVAALLLIIGKAAVTAFALGFARSFEWLSTGAQWGALIAAGAVPVALVLPRRPRLALALLVLVAGSAALALLPVSAYAPNAAASVLSSPVRNFVGALDWLAYVWPVLALAYLGWQLAAYNEGVPQDSGATR